MATDVCLGFQMCGWASRCAPTHTDGCMDKQMCVGVVGGCTFGLQQAGDAQLVLRQAEGLLQVVPVAPAAHQLHVHQVGPDGVDHRVEGHAAAPARPKVLHLDALAPGGAEETHTRTRG